MGCPYCRYRQNWAHAFHVSREFEEALDDLVRKFGRALKNPVGK